MYTVYFIFFQLASATATRFGLSRGLLGLQYEQINESESESESGLVSYVGKVAVPGDWDNIIRNVIFKRQRRQIILQHSQILPFRMSVVQTNSQIYPCQTLGRALEHTVKLSFDFALCKLG